MFKKMLTAAVVAGLATACAADGDPFVDWDADRDERLTTEEYGLGIEGTGMFQDWDLDNDGFLDENEWETATAAAGIATPHGFEAWDRNEDRLLAADELYGGSFERLDVDDDGYVTRTEFAGAKTIEW